MSRSVLTVFVATLVCAGVASCVTDVCACLATSRAIVYGTVGFTDGRPAAGVHVFGTNSGGGGNGSTTDGQGRYRFEMGAGVGETLDVTVSARHPIVGAPVYALTPTPLRLYFAWSPPFDSVRIDGALPPP